MQRDLRTYRRRYYYVVVYVLGILRLLKHALAREVFCLLTQHCDVDDYSDLRPARQGKNITVTAAAQYFGVWPTVISRLERGLQRDDGLVADYRQWLAAP